MWRSTSFCTRMTSAVQYKAADIALTSALRYVLSDGACRKLVIIKVDLSHSTHCLFG